MRTILTLIGASLAVSAAAAATTSPTITDLAPIALHSGVNQVANMSGDGRDGMIVLGWRDNGNAHGFDLALVLVEAGRGGPWNVVRVERPEAEQATGWSDGVTDDPHTGEDMVRSFRFAHGRVGGTPATLLLIATRDPGETIPDPSRVTFQVYRLEHAPDVGTTPDHFTLVMQDRSSGPYCNAEMALSRRFDVPLRTSYAGPKTVDGCQH